MLNRTLSCAVALIACCAVARAADVPETVWLEAETFGPLHGSNFSYQPVEKTTKGSWSVSGPGVAAEWTQGGESEWMSVAARADEAGEVVAGRDAVVPVGGRYVLWVRYADYRDRRESFGVRVRQGNRVFTHVFGERAVVDEMDPMKLLWDWAFAWDRAEVELQRGPVHVELYTTGPTEARRQVDCLCLTTDAGYRPTGREKPDHSTWRALRGMREAAGGAAPAQVETLAARKQIDVPAPWKVAEGPPAFTWNTGRVWLEELGRAERVDYPFGVDPPLEKAFVAAFRGKAPPVFSHPLSGAAWHISVYPSAFEQESPFLDWLDRHREQRFVILLNYGDPDWPKGSPPDPKGTAGRLKKYGDRFAGYIAGESIAHTGYDGETLDRRIKAATSRADVLAALREAHVTSVVKKFSGYTGEPLTPEQAMGPLISCLSANMEAYAHALAAWGCKRVGHENTGNSPTLARRLAFLRGTARQFGGKFVDYQSANLGDAATMFSRQNFLYPASSRYVLDNSYDAFAGAGVNWLLKDYVLWHLAGVDVFYNEQGIDLFWKPAGQAAGDDFPLQLSPKGKVAEAMQNLAAKHPRGTQVTPVAFLLDEAHGWAQERFVPGAFGVDPQSNPAVLTPGRHEAAIRGWFDVAYYPAPETQNEPATGIRQTYVNGIFGDLFDVIVTAPGHADILKTYPVVIAAGEVPLSDEWGKALRAYVEGGGTLVTCAETFRGPGAGALGLPANAGGEGEASEFSWKSPPVTIASNRFRVSPIPTGDRRVLATTGDDTAVVTVESRGKGRLVYVAVPLGLGLDDRPVPPLAYVMRHVTEGLVPVRAMGDVEWTLSRLDDGGWLVGLLNNRGVNKPQHGVNPTDHRESQSVVLTTAFPVGRAEEWMTGSPADWKPDQGPSTATVAVPAGAVRLIAVYPKP